MNLSSGLDVLIEKLNGWYEDIMFNLPNLAISILVASVGYFLSRYIRKSLVKIIGRFSKSRTIIKTFANIGTTFFFILIFFLILGILNLDKALNTVLASAGVVGLAVGLALQEPLTNIFSGVMLSVKEKYNIGDLIETNGYFGVIKDVNLKSTTIDLPSGESLSIPNKMILQNPITNYTINGQRRVNVTCGVSYADDLETVRAIAIKAIRKHIDFIQDKGVQILFTEYGDSSINFELRFWIHKTNQGQFLKAKNEAIIVLKKAFDREGISIPFPIRTLDFGIKGTERLEEQFENDFMKMVESNN